MQVVVDLKFIEAAINIIHNAIHKNASPADVTKFIEDFKANCKPAEQTNCGKQD